MRFDAERKRLGQRDRVVGRDRRTFGFLAIAAAAAADPVNWNPFTACR